MNQKKRLSLIILIVILSCSIMAIVDAVISPNYLVKSIIKMVLFLLIPFLATRANKDFSLKDLFKIKKKQMILPILLGVIVYFFILSAYFIIGPYFDFSNVTVALGENYGVNKENFIIVALYISLVNSLLEEFFFRGFAFILLKKFSTRRFAYLFSAGAFSIYHIAFMSDWFQPVLFLLLLSSLFIAGLMFNWLNEKRETIYTSWLVHMCANFAINTVGFLLFGILS